MNLEQTIKHNILDYNYEYNLILLVAVEMSLQDKYVKTNTFKKYDRNILSLSQQQRKIFLSDYNFFINKIKMDIEENEYLFEVK